jgi:glycosyltransferase involved in cell wall biosynthesis
MSPWSIDVLGTGPVETSASGGSRAVWELSAALVSRGHRVRVLYPDPAVRAPPPYRGIERVPVPLVGGGRRPIAREIAIGKNASSLLDARTDVVFGNDTKAGSLELPRGSHATFGMYVHDVALHSFDAARPTAPSKGFRSKVGDWIDRGTVKRLESRALRRSRFILVSSSHNQKLLGDYYHIGSAQSHAIPTGIPDPVEVGSREDARLALHVPRDVPVAVFVGRSPDRQGLPLALDAFRRVRVFFPGARFLIAGSNMRSEPGVSALGLVDEVTKAQVLRAADVFLFPARVSGYDLPPREAMRYGIATVVSPQVSLDGIPVETAVRVVAGDQPGDYASVLAELLADPAMRRTLGTAGREATDHFSYAKMAERFEAVVRPTIAG